MATERKTVAGLRRARLWTRALALLLVLSLSPPGATQQQARMNPVEVEAAFLINFLRYTQWPPERFESADSPYVITVVGSQQAADSVRAVAGAASRIGGRSIEVRSMTEQPGSLSAPTSSQRDRDALAQLRGSHVVYFHSSAGNALPDQALEALWGQPVLTVSNVPGFTSAGGMLGLVKASDHIVFEANPVAIRHARLLLSAKVLKLARLTGSPR